MDPFLLKILFLVNAMLVISTTVTVVYKLGMINGPNAHIVIAILSILVLIGYTGVLNAVFLQKRFRQGRIFYILVAALIQFTILVLSFLSVYNVLQYSLVI